MASLGSEAQRRLRERRFRQFGHVTEPGRAHWPALERPGSDIGKGGPWRALRSATAGGERYRTPDGKSRSLTFDRKAEAKKHLVAMEHRKLTGGYVDPSAGKVAVGDYLGNVGERGNLAWLTVTSSTTSSRSWARCRSMGCAGVRSSMEHAAPGPAHDPTDSAVPLVDARCVGCRPRLIATNPARGAARPRATVKPIVPLADEDVDSVPRSSYRVVPRRLRPWARCRPASVRDKRPDRRPRRLPPA